MKRPKKNSPKIDRSWTLFLDRDGVINRKIENGYVCKWRDFRFIPSFLEHIGRLSTLFGRVIIVTNQRCIAKGLLTRSGLQAIHRKMLKRIRDAGGRIDKIYYCPHETAENCDCRKPKIGMARRAKKDFRDIHFKRSVMAGDSMTDMEFGKKAGMITALIVGKRNMDRSMNADQVLANIGELLNEAR